ncbi:MAG: acetylxylan esterase [Gemmataceae bacterium]
MTRLTISLLVAVPLLAHADEAAVKAALAKPIIGQRQSLTELQDYLEPRLPKLPVAEDAEAWNKLAAKLRRDVLDRAVLRGEAKAWQKAKLGVEYLETIDGGEKYKIRKLRYEAVPGLWVPALLYVPDARPAKTPVMLAVNGHDAKGKAAPYKQVRCINLAKRGMIVLNVEWFGMGQLRDPGYRHGCMNQLDLCGTSGLAPFYLAMTRGLDVLLAQPNADPARVAVSGLSGGGWQTIVVSALDERVTLANPVAGYSGFKIRLRDHFKDLGDSEQTPVDLATVADYTHLTALRAPRPTLLTYNSKDECCFEAGYALPPLLAAARPAFKLFGKDNALRSHINHDPGTHNYLKENREALYRMVGDFFYPGDKSFDPKEIPCDKEVKPSEALAVELPKGNASLNSLARGLAKSLPRGKPTREKLREVVKASDFTTDAREVGRAESNGTTAVLWRLYLSKTWSVPVVELSRGNPTKTAIVLHDSGRAADTANAERLLKGGHRVLAVDVFYFGEAKLFAKDWLFALLVSALGDRPLGLQASQLAAVARWSEARHGQAPTVSADGPRTSLIALVAAALEEKAIAGLELRGCRASLKEIIEENRTVDQLPEAFCFGLLEACDVAQLRGLIAPRRVINR